MSVIAKANENPVTIRFPRGVLDALTESARRNGRSRNSEAVLRLAESLGVQSFSEGAADPGRADSVQGG